MLNPELKKGDRIVLIQMVGEPIAPFTRGTVGDDGIVIQGIKQYKMEWEVPKGESGRNYALIEGEDKWMLESDYDKMMFRKKNKLSESDGEFNRNKRLISNIDVFNYFNLKFLKDYLIMIRDSGIVNMMGAAPYLYMGKDRIEKEHSNITNEEEFEEVLNNADKSQREMIKGVVKILDKEGKESSLDNINRYLKNYSNRLLMVYIDILQ